MINLFHIGAWLAAALSVVAGLFAAKACLTPSRSITAENIAGAAAIAAVGLVAAGFVLWGGYEMGATLW